MKKHAIPTIAALVSIFAFSGCAERSGQEDDNDGRTYQDNIKTMVEIKTYDNNNFEEEKGYGFYVAPDVVVTNLDWLKGGYRARITTISSDKTRKVEGYTAYDLDRDLVALKVSGNQEEYLKVDSAINHPDSLYTLRASSGKLYTQKGKAGAFQDMDSLSYWSAPSNMDPGKPAFNFDHNFMGIVQKLQTDDSREKAVLPAKWINDLLAQQSDDPSSIYGLRLKSNKVYISHEKVEGIRIETTMGDIMIKLYDETPKFRDNFIKLTSDDFYDSLLIHRVVDDFLIQTGAADSKNAEEGEELGYEGPGYKLPTNIQPSLYHKRGAVSVPKLPEENNPRNKSDGSQFFIVSGHQFTNEQLDKIEEEEGTEFSEEQRQTYTTEGGAPELDGEYSVIGEVISGMDVVDRIASVETDRNERPLNDIMIKDIEIIEK